jgi:hypothetical protein
VLELVLRLELGAAALEVALAVLGEPSSVGLVLGGTVLEGTPVPVATPGPVGELLAWRGGELVAVMAVSPGVKDVFAASEALAPSLGEAELAIVSTPPGSASFPQLMAPNAQHSIQALDETKRTRASVVSHLRDSVGHFMGLS